MNYTIVTCGDVDGIGFEIAAKSLSKIKFQSGNRVILIRPKKPLKDWSSVYKRSAQKSDLHSLKDISHLLESRKIDSSFNGKSILEICSSENPVDWVEDAGRTCLNNKNFSIVNAPLSKTLIAETGRTDHGHTDIYKRLSGIKEVNMAFIGKYFNVVLGTDHVPLSEVEKTLSSSILLGGIQNAFNLKSLLGKAGPIAVLGLNPHAGEKGVIGSYESIFNESLLKSAIRKFELYGPLPADSFFARGQWKEYSVIFAMYHDQGLIPFKMQHRAHPSVHMTLGLPFIRTSVDHGTAKDIANKGKADFSSMLAALKFNLKILNKRGS